MASWDYSVRYFVRPCGRDGRSKGFGGSSGKWISTNITKRNTSQQSPRACPNSFETNETSCQYRGTQECVHLHLYTGNASRHLTRYPAPRKGRSFSLQIICGMLVPAVRDRLPLCERSDPSHPESRAGIGDPAVGIAREPRLD